MNKPKNRDKDIVVQEFANEILIYDLKTNKAYCLNQTSAMIWQMCDGSKTVAEISQSLTKKLKQPITEELIWLALDGFKKDDLLEQNEQFAINFNGLSRRQVIKKVGFASMIALPLVSSLIAPSAAQAASCSFIGGQPCSMVLSVANCCAGQGLCGDTRTCIACTDPGGFSYIANNFGCNFDFTNCRDISECEVCRDAGPIYCCSGVMNRGGACA